MPQPVRHYEGLEDYQESALHLSSGMKGAYHGGPDNYRTLRRNRRPLRAIRQRPLAPVKILGIPGDC